MIRYYPEMPIDAVRPLAFVLNPGADQQAQLVRHGRKLWEHDYGVDLHESLKERGQLSPGTVLWYPEHGEWCIVKAHARWCAMRELGWLTFKTLVLGDDIPFKSDHIELHSVEEVMALYDAQIPVTFPYGYLANFLHKISEPIRQRSTA